MKDIKLVLWEIDKKINSWDKIDVEIFDNPEKVETIDAFLFRFSKMQDTMGEKLFPLILDKIRRRS